MAACRSGDGTPRQLRTDRTGALDVMAALMLRTLRPLSSLLFRRAKHGREEPAFGATDSPGLPDKESAQAWRQWLDAVGDLKCADDFEPNRLPAAG